MILARLTTKGSTLSIWAKYYISRPPQSDVLYITLRWQLIRPTQPIAVHGPSALANMLLNWFTAIGARTLEEQDSHDPDIHDPGSVSESSAIA